jgi:hypothetical protein
MQVLMGNLNTVSMMSPFLNVFKCPLNDYLAHLQVNEDDLIQLRKQAIKDLGVWTNFLCNSEKWHLIPQRPCNPPLTYKLFFSKCLYRWFENPVEDWDLCMKLLYHVIKKC